MPDPGSLMRLAAVGSLHRAANPNPAVEAAMNELLAHYAIQVRPFKGRP